MAGGAAALLSVLRVKDLRMQAFLAVKACVVVWPS
jgi:hypothetical protein